MKQAVEEVRAPFEPPRMKRLFPNGRVLTWELAGYGWVLVARNWP